MRDVARMPNYDRLISSEQMSVASSANGVVQHINHDEAGACATTAERSLDHKLTADASKDVLPSWERVGTFAHAKRAAIVSALQNCDYNVAATATQLEIGRSTIYRLFEEYCIEPSVLKASVVLEAGGPICRVVVDQPPNVGSRLLFEDGKLKLVELAVRN